MVMVYAVLLDSIWNVVSVESPSLLHYRLNVWGKNQKGNKLSFWLSTCSGLIVAPLL